MIESSTSARPDARAQTRPKCPVCGLGSTEPFFDLATVPVHCNILWPTAAEAQSAVRGAVSLVLCSGCGLVFNAAFDPSLVTYDESYENSLHHSPRFEAYAEALARDLSDRLNLRDQLVVEVGCGKGEFLRRLCQTAGARGVGIDASYDPNLAPADADDSVRFIREAFTSVPKDLQPALVFCRHVLEHLQDPAPFVGRLAEPAMRSAGCRVFIEVPNVLSTLRDLGIWDIIYEHCNYFSAPALGRLCESAGLSVERAYTAFGEQFLCIEAHGGQPSPSPTHSGDVRELRELAARFSSEYRHKVTRWQTRLSQFHVEGRTVALWGAGSKGITFANSVPGGGAGGAVTCLVDLNPRKHGRFVPGTGQPVVPPNALKQLRPDVIIVMNPLYREEIGTLARELGLDCLVEVA
jgi:SAM-dependent methyltransferase